MREAKGADDRMGQLIRECLFCGPFSGGVAEDSLFHIPGLAQAEGGFQFRGLWGTAYSVIKSS